MSESDDGERVLMAPTRETADFVRRTYVFDTVRVVPVYVSADGAIRTVTAGSLVLRFTTGRGGLLGFMHGAHDGPARPCDQETVGAAP
ncbi:hypothetical protein [Streptomyces sp. NPDC050416]|uniref:hypothetical protein n=1 Tax=Streptomyces sp. NPDC050416 TaxID=3365611 RepID=UPI0037A440C2